MIAGGTSQAARRGIVNLTFSISHKNRISRHEQGSGEETTRRAGRCPIGGLGGQESEEEDPGQGTERSQIMQAGAILEPSGFPLGRVERLVLDEKTVFIEAERLFKLDEDLFRQPMPVLLLEDEAAEQAAPDHAGECEKQDVDGRKAAFERTQEKSTGHRE